MKLGYRPCTRRPPGGRNRRGRPVPRNQFHVSRERSARRWISSCVLSGFLITTLLIGEHKERNVVSLSSFYRRRALRLFPAVVLLATFLAVALVAGDAKLALVGAAAGFGYVTNFVLASDHVDDLPFGLTHLWSLSAEEAVLSRLAGCSSCGPSRALGVSHRGVCGRPRPHADQSTGPHEPRSVEPSHRIRRRYTVAPDPRGLSPRTALGCTAGYCATHRPPTRDHRRGRVCRPTSR